MKNYALLGSIMLIAMCCILQGCSATETVTVLPPAQETQPIEISTSLPPSLPSPTFLPAATGTYTPIPFTPTLTTVAPEPTATRTFAPFIPGYLVFSVWRTPPHGIAVMSSNGSSRRWVINDNPTAIYDDPTWSPDGHWIAFSLYYLDESDNEIYIVNVDGSGLRRITYDVHWNMYPAWSPDGQEIAFTTPDLYILNLANGGSRRIGQILHDISDIAWSPDGKQIVVRAASEDGGYYLFIIDVNENNVTQATDYQIGGGRISWSPDGKQIAHRSGGQCGDICILNLEDGTHRCIKSTVGGVRDLAWSPDEGYIAFLATQVYCESTYVGWQIYITDVEGTAINQLTATDIGYSGLAWSQVPSLQIGSSYMITEWGDRLTVRDTPSMSGAFLTQLLQGDMVTILEGPVDAEDYYWWRLRTEDGIEGWAVEVYRWYQPVGE